MTWMRRLLDDRQAAGLLTGLVAYLMVAQMALASAVCGMTVFPSAGGSDAVICTVFESAPDEAPPDGGHAHDCQCMVGNHHCAPVTTAAPVAASFAAPPAEPSTWSLAIRDAIAHFGSFGLAGNPRAPPARSA